MDLSSLSPDLNAASVLIYALERGKFNVYALRLEKYYDEDLTYVHPGARKNITVPGGLRAENFFLGLYKEMGVKPTPDPEPA